MEQLMYRPVEAANLLGMGRTAVFGLIKRVGSGRSSSAVHGSSPLMLCELSFASWSRSHRAMMKRRWLDA